MKRLIGLVVLALIGASAAWSQAALPTEAPSAGSPVMEFESMEVDYGVIQQNAEPYREFHFTNTGDAPLIISNAKGSCGCTVPEWPKEPVQPGESNVIKVRYATNRIGKFNKTVTLTTNDAEGQHVLRISGEVLQPAQEPAQDSGNSNNR